MVATSLQGLGDGGDLFGDVVGLLCDGGNLLGDGVDFIGEIVIIIMN